MEADLEKLGPIDGIEPQSPCWRSRIPGRGRPGRGSEELAVLKDWKGRSSWSCTCGVFMVGRAWASFLEFPRDAGE